MKRVRWHGKVSGAGSLERFLQFKIVNISCITSPNSLVTIEGRQVKTHLHRKGKNVTDPNYIAYIAESE